MVYDVGNDVQLAVVLAIVDDDNPSHLHIPLERHVDGLIALPSDPKCCKRAGGVLTSVLPRLKRFSFLWHWH